MSTEMYENLVKAVGGDTSALPDRLKTTYLKAMCEALGIDTSGMADNLETSYYQLIIDKYAGGGDSVAYPAPGLYQTGAIALYEEQGAEAVEGMMVKSWDELVNDDTVVVENCSVYTHFDPDTGINSGADALEGDLFISKDNGITSIGITNDETRSGFTCCYKLTGVVVPEGITKVEPYAFAICSNLKLAVLPNSLTTIGECAFQCETLESVVFGNNSHLNIIGSEAFAGCESLKSITIPHGVTSIEDYTFDGCSSLNSVVFENNSQLTTISERAFSNCTELSSITIPHGVITIGDRAFDGCEGLVSITIEENSQLEYIGTDSFLYCTGLESIVVEPGCDNYHSEGNCLIETKSKTLRVGCKTSVIPDDGSVTTIAAYAFCGSGIESIIIPNGVNAIYNDAFCDCWELTSVTIPNSVNSFGEFAFCSCGALISITFEGTITQWNAITKGDYWNDDVPATHVTCSDGTVSLV